MTNIQPDYVLDGISLTTTGAVLAPEKLTKVQFDGAGTTVVDVSSANVVIGGVTATPDPLAFDGTVNFAEPGSWDNPNGFTDSAHGITWSVDAPGSTFLSAKYTTESPPAIAREYLAFGVGMTFVADPSLDDFIQWAEVISGLFGPDAAFGADPNGDGVVNGLAFLYGAPDANGDARTLAPTWAYIPDLIDEVGQPPLGGIVFSFRRSDLASVGIGSVVQYTTDLANWTTAVSGEDAITIIVNDDLHGPGIDGVEVRLPETLAPGGALYLRLRAGP
jgi:hypothetical protein